VFELEETFIHAPVWDKEQGTEDWQIEDLKKKMVNGIQTTKITKRTT